MSHAKAIHISVRNLVEFVLRRGSINSSYTRSNRATEGIRLHQKLQKLRKKTAELNNYEYVSEFKLTHNFEYNNFIFNVEGRADGIIIDKKYTAIEEIKTTIKQLESIEEETNQLHWAQAKCYAYIYAFENQLETIAVELIYCKVDTEELKIFTKYFSIDELKIYFYDLIQNYIVWVEMTIKWVDIRNSSIKQLTFPYDYYRQGQRELAVATYKTIVQKKKLFAQAPTGTGKTISTLFPAIKALGENHTSKIFYLTARTITRQIVEDALNIMKQKGLSFKSIILTAKEKICFCKQSSCTPEQCPYAEGHFDRINDALLDILECENLINRINIEQYAQKHKVCPFEFSLDLTLWCDCIICDYNYVFDPKVYLKRFFQDNETNDYVFLVDEAHNLVDRAREMFSASINKKTFLYIKKQIKDKKISKSIKNINQYMLSIMKDVETETIKKEEPQDLYIYLREFTNAADIWLAKNEVSDKYKELLECYFQVTDFLRISDFYDDKYVTYTQTLENEFSIKLFCLNPSYLLCQAEQRSRATIFFSATLTPLNYFKQILGGNETDFFMKLQSPFKYKNLELLIAGNISTKWKNREYSYESIAEYLNVFINGKIGNYFAFFPSYQYMIKVYEIFSEKYTQIEIIIQDNNMNEQQKEDYLKKFNAQQEKSLLGFAVMGGIFSEGIDLVGNKLIGAVIIGVGLPQISMERNIISSYYSNSINKGYEFAYMYPGMNKVMQAVGRVIRTENDKGAVMLIDERFLLNDYKKLFPYEWKHYKKIYNSKQLKQELSTFWTIKNS